MDGPTGGPMPVTDGLMLGSDSIYWMGWDAYSNDLYKSLAHPFENVCAT
jgi:hypothetical protein